MMPANENFLILTIGALYPLEDDLTISVHIDGKPQLIASINPNDTHILLSKLLQFHFDKLAQSSDWFRIPLVQIGQYEYDVARDVYNSTPEQYRKEATDAG